MDKIREKYGFNDEDLESIRTNLRKKLGEAHPDNNNGKYDADKFETIKRDLEYVESKLNNSDNSIMIPLDAAMNMLMKNMQNNQMVAYKEECENRLGKSVEKRIEVIKSRFRPKKIGLTTITAVLTFMWMMPETLLSNPAIEFLIETMYVIDSRIFYLFITEIWLVLCVLTGCYWLSAARIENREKAFMERLRLESVQNELFLSFIKEVGDKKFSKQEFMEYIHKEYYYYERRRPYKGLGLAEDVVQNVADVILERAKDCKLIEKVEGFSLVECYMAKKETNLVN